MLRFFILFMGIQLTLFGINMLGWIQQHLVLHWAPLATQIPPPMSTSNSPT